MIFFKFLNSKGIVYPNTTLVHLYFEFKVSNPYKTLILLWKHGSIAKFSVLFLRHSQNIMILHRRVFWNYF